MLSIKPVLYILININLVNDLIGILLKRSSKNNNLIILRHELNELNTSWPHQKKAILTVLDIVNQGLIQVQDQGVQVVFVKAF